jgi:hypothetical protein
MNILVPGVRMFSVSLEPGTEHICLPTLVEEPGGQSFFQSFPGLITPFGLPIECFPKEGMLDKNLSLVMAVNVMLQGAVAESTSLQYGAVVLEFHQFCVAEKIVFPHFTESTVLEFFAISFSRGRPLGLFCTLLAALFMIEKVTTGRGASAITDQVWSAVYTLQRQRQRQTLSAVTLVTPPHTDQCDYCMCIRLINKHNESKPFQCISDREPHVTHRVNNTKQRQIKC